MTGIAIVLGAVVAMVLLLALSRVPAAVVVLGAALTLYAAGILDLGTALGGFGDPTILFIASLLVVSAALDATGVTAWVGQRLVRDAGGSRARLVALTMAVAGGLAALVGSSGAVAALLPVVTLVAVRVGRSPSLLLMPLAFAAQAGSLLLLTGSLVNVLIADALSDAGLPPLGFAELAAVGLPALAGTIAIVVLLGGRLLPARTARTIPEDLSGHTGTLQGQYSLFDGLVPLQVMPGSAYAGARRGELDVDTFEGLRLVVVLDRSTGGPIRRRRLEPGDTIMVRGARSAAEALAAARGLRQDPANAAARQTLFNSISGLAEVVVPPRSRLIGQAVFPGMLTQSGDFAIMAVQRRGESTGPGETTLAAGDTLLLQGAWRSLQRLPQDPDVLVVDNPDLVRRQAIPMGAGARRTIAVLCVMVALLATDLVPRVVAGLGAACAIVLLRVLPIEQAYRAINWTALIMVAGLMPLATAMHETGAAGLIAELLVRGAGGGSAHALQALVFIVAVLLAQAISSTATALILIPVALAAATELAVSPRPVLIAVCLGAAASFLTPIASTANLIAQGPAGYRFGDYWRLGLPLVAWFFVLAVAVVPLIWSS